MKEYVKNKRTLLKKLLDLLLYERVCDGSTMQVSSEDAKKSVGDLLNLRGKVLTEEGNILKVYIRVPNDFRKKAGKYAEK